MVSLPSLLRVQSYLWPSAPPSTPACCTWAQPPQEVPDRRSARRRATMVSGASDQGLRTADCASDASRSDAGDLLGDPVGLLDGQGRLRGGEHAQRLAEVGTAHRQQRVRPELGPEVGEQTTSGQGLGVALLALQDNHPSVLIEQPREDGRAGTTGARVDA